MNKIATIVFNDDVTQEKVDNLVDTICELLKILNITAVIQVDEQEVCDEQA
jgi:hypothetical protein